MSDEVPKSYERINYSLRPAKAIERRMMCEAFGRLYPFQPVNKYGYIGLGSIYFTDFQLIHRLLGIDDLVSIEKDFENAERFNLNLPFGCIQIHFKETSLVLPSLDWSSRKILWLDYDGTLNSDCLADVATFVTKASSGSFLAISINAHAVAEPHEGARKAIEERTNERFSLPVYRLSKIREQIPEKVPVGLSGKELNMSGLPKVLRRLLINEISEVLKKRNQQLPDDDKLSFKQVLNFIYKDGAQMMTLGGVVVSRKELSLFEACRFDELVFSRTTDEVFDIRVPCLTPKEVRYLNSFLPLPDTESIAPNCIPGDDIEKYRHLYRYFPYYGEVVFG
jgi:hypothetical protein